MLLPSSSFFFLPSYSSQYRPTPNGVTHPSASPDTKYQPSRPLTPEIDPPAPTLAQWRRRYDFAPNTDTIYHEIPNPDIDM